MIQTQSIVKVADNSGAKTGKVLRVLGGTGRRYARLGDVVVVGIQSAEPRKTVKRKEIHQGVVVRQAASYRRRDGSAVRFDENAVVLIEKGGTAPNANRVFGPIPREIGERGFQKIASLAPEVV